MSAPDALFDLAVNRAANTLRGLRPADRAAALAEWHARTRFARRVPLPDIEARLETRPDGAWHWAGGPGGAWQPGKARFP
ncbi:hypothetical protein [Deinococcus maricopensis]|uniref:Uncharacterized protein n=1 Tax=Deinococcus maricopensis (strain DSM 21211 / LMG 22137 / NRRL B-23946 / LB-34) TaxID=709986 RepID=E8UA88_DEIML|nr:hypothetical protein [Deinococcus maricopensis]ADV67977.1 hypothetical protein Deima_2339 [Deinococcus maricopensis DSM 21211]